MQGFYTKGGREDVGRAANFVLRMVCDGRVLFYFLPKESETIEADIASGELSDELQDQPDMIESVTNAFELLGEA